MARKRSEDVLQEYRESGLTQQEFCKKKGISLSVLQYQMKRERQGAPHQFVRVGGSTSGLEVECRNGVKVRLPADCDEGVLARVLEAAGAVS